MILRAPSRGRHVNSSELKVQSKKNTDSQQQKHEDHHDKNRLKSHFLISLIKTFNWSKIPNPCHGCVKDCFGQSQIPHFLPATSPPRKVISIICKLILPPLCPVFSTKDGHPTKVKSTRYSSYESGIEIERSPVSCFKWPQELMDANTVIFHVNERSGRAEPKKMERREMCWSWRSLNTKIPLPCLSSEPSRRRRIHVEIKMSPFICDTVSRSQLQVYGEVGFPVHNLRLSRPTLPVTVKGPPQVFPTSTFQAS